MDKALHIFDNILKDYQKEGVNKMIDKSFYQADDMGAGKTLQTLTALEMSSFNGYTIIVAPKFALKVWQGEIKHWFDKESTIYSGTPTQRKKQIKEFLESGRQYLITNFAMLKEVGGLLGIQHKDVSTPPPGTPSFKLKALVIDEAHMSGVLNYKTQFYKTAKAVSRQCTLTYILSGTPIRKGCIDLYGPFSLIDPKTFNSYWNYISRWCVTIQTPFGKQIERNPSNLMAFREMMSRYLIRRTKEEILTELKGKVRQKLPVDMTKKQQKYFTDLQEELMAYIEETDELILTPGVLSCILRQRQLLACPEVLGIPERSPAIDAVIDHSALKLDNDEPVVVFSTFRNVLENVAARFKEEYPGISVYEIKGGLKAEEFGAAWQNFQNGKGKRVLTVVIKSGASFQATAADTAYFIGPEWDVTLNEQAEDRLYRIGQKKLVNIFYVDYGTEVEQRVWDLLNEKKESAQFITGTDGEFLKALRKRSSVKN